MNNLLILDFDDTLFNTQNIKGLLAEFFRKNFNVDFFEDYDNSKNEFGAYSIFKHIELLRGKKSIEEWNYEKIQNELLNFFTENKSRYEFEFDDVANLIAQAKSQNYDILILTLGYSKFQSIKKQMCPSLNSIPMICILEDKAQYLKKNISRSSEKNDYELIHFTPLGKSYSRILFIDDKLKSFPQENNFFEKLSYFWLVRDSKKNEQKKVSSDKKISIINSLDEVTTF